MRTRDIFVDLDAVARFVGDCMVTVLDHRPIVDDQVFPPGDVLCEFEDAFGSD